MVFFKRNKKGALELSVTAIVVLIIAITILGLVIVFVKKSFTGATDIVGGQLSKIKSDLQDSLRNSGELLIVQPDNVEARRGKPEQFLVAIQNTAQNPDPTGVKKTVCFMLQFECKAVFAPPGENTCSGIINDPKSIVVGGNAPVAVGSSPAGPPTAKNTWVKGLLGGGKVDIPNGESGIFPTTILMNQKADTYRLELTVFKDDGNKECASTNPSSMVPYATKTFDVKLQQ